VDHDQRFKALIREFFRDFLRLFFAEWAERFDLDTVEWLDTEILPDPPEGSRHVLDLVARVTTREPVENRKNEESEKWIALLHIEIESPDRTTNLKPRLPGYYIHLGDRYGLPVLPIVLYLKVGLDGIGIDTYEQRFWELTVLRFSYLYVGLPGLEALQYVIGDNWLGVALSALMRIPPEKVSWLGLEALRRIGESSLNEQQKFLLRDCVEAYLPLDERHKGEFEKLMAATPEQRVQSMNKTTYDRGLEKGLEQGIEKGIEKGLQTTLLRQGSKRFGPPTPELESRIRSIQNISQLEAMTEKILDSQSWNELLEST
jgi:hypothetical protein